MKNTPKILLIEDDSSAAAGLARVLADEGMEVKVVLRGDEGLEIAKKESFDLVLTDLKLPGLNGLEVIQQLHQAKPRLPIILMTAHGTTETAIEATKTGAYDYLVKPFEMQEMLELAHKAITSGQLMSEPVEIAAPLSDHDAIIGNSRVMQNIYKEIGRIATKPVTVLIRGETGTGKELVARAIYQHSERAQAPFVAINCAAIPETLLESELFGHERGAFTGAETRRIGRFEQAQGGTLFLDEIGDMPLSTQAKLLRVLQERSIQRLAGKEVIPVDIRVIAATHHDLEAALKNQRFREDLYYRLNVVTLQLPPLRQRTEDIPALVKYFLRRHGKEMGIENPSIQSVALDWLKEQPWPGNVRELENIIRQALLRARKFSIGLDDVKLPVTKTAEQAAPLEYSIVNWIGEWLKKAQNEEVDDVYRKLMEEIEEELFSQAIKLAQGNQAKAARWLGISRLTMREKLLHFSLHPSAEPGAKPE